jgi:tripartite-type tricarboxylate transporter receptor subunit TctC
MSESARKEGSALPLYAACSKTVLRRSVLSLFATLGFLACIQIGSVAAQTLEGYPNQVIRLIVPFAAGGLPDTVARIVAVPLQARLKQPVIVENRPGAGGGVAASFVASLPANGYQLLVTDNSFLSTNPFLYRELTYNPKDFIAVARIATAPLFLAVHPIVPVKTMNEFIDYAKANPGKINYGSSGIGTMHHLSMEAIKAHYNLDMTHVPFRGTGDSVPALLGGHVGALFSAYPSLSGGVATKQITLIASNGPKRSPQLPNVPTVAEFIPGFDFASRIGIFARSGTPTDVVELISKTIVTITGEQDTIDRLAALGIEAAGSGPEEAQKVLQDEITRVTAVVKAAGIEPQ